MKTKGLRIDDLDERSARRIGSEPVGLASKFRNALLQLSYGAVDGTSSPWPVSESPGTPHRQRDAVAVKPNPPSQLNSSKLARTRILPVLLGKAFGWTPCREICHPDAAREHRVADALEPTGYGKPESRTHPLARHSAESVPLHAGQKNRAKMDSSSGVTGKARGRIFPRGDQDGY